MGCVSHFKSSLFSQIPTLVLASTVTHFVAKLRTYTLSVKFLTTDQHFPKVKCLIPSPRSSV